MVDEEKQESWLIPSFWTRVENFFKAGFEAVWSGFTMMFPNLFDIVWNKIIEHSSDIESGMWSGMLGTYANAGMLTEEELQRLMKLKDVGHPYDWFFYIAMQLKLSSTYIDASTEAPSNLIRQASYKKHRPNLPEYRDVMGAAFVAPEKTDEVREMMARQGLTDANIDLLFLAAYRLYDENMIRVLFLRGILDKDQMFMRMRELGYTDTRINEMVQSWEIIPGPQDLFFMVGKEAFEPEFIEKIGLGDEFPEEQSQWLAKQGISDFWAHKYWYAHWDQPSVGQGFEMLHRGVIDRDELDMLFKAVEMPPFWREKLTQVAFQVYTRVDTRRMHDMGVLTDEELVTAYMDQGYDYTKATKMADFTKKYNQQSQKDLTKGQILSSYIDNLITREDAKALLMQIDFPEPQAEFNLSYEEFKRDKKYSEAILKNIKSRFTLNLIDEFEARKRLAEINVDGIRINILIDTWKIDVYDDMKVPSKTDLDKFYRNKIIDVDRYRREMKKLGYNWEYSQWYEKLIGMKKAG